MTYRFADPRLIHSDASPEALAVARMWVFGMWVVLALQDAMMAQAGLQASLRVPLGIMPLVPSGLIEWLSSPGGLLTFKVTLVTACAAAALGLLTRVAMVVAITLVILWQTLSRSFMGYANHAELPLLFAALVLAISPCDRALVLWPRARRDPGPAACQFPLVAILGITCLTYLFIGTFRLTHGLPGLFQSNALSEWILSLNLRYADPGTSLGVAWIGNPVLRAGGKVGFFFLTLLEVATPFCLMSWRFRAAWLPAMLLAHVGILLLMRIDFTNQVLCYLFFIDSRHWAPARTRASTSTVFFDGYCGLCNGFVDFVLARDRERKFRFAPLQGSTSIARFGDPGDVDPSTIILEEDGIVFERSTAALRIISRLGGAWGMVAVLGLVPRPIRDAVYDWVARHRYGWFGKRDTCRIPTPEERAVFLD